MQHKVIVIGHGYTSRLGMIRALGSAGYEVIVIVMVGLQQVTKANNAHKPIDCYSKYVSKVFYCVSDREQLISLLLTKCVVAGHKPVIIPDSDFSASTIDLFQERLKDFFLFPHINHTPGLLVEWMEKPRQKNLARELGLNVAEGRSLEVVDGHYSIPSDIVYPCFSKPLATIKGGKLGLRRCNNEAELRTILDILAQQYSSLSVLVEEYKEIEVEYAVLGLATGCDVIIPGIIQNTSMAHGGHFGVAKQGKIMSIIGFEDIISKFKSLVLQTGFVGIFDIDFYQSGGNIYFCELNLRYGGSGYAVTKMGVNLPAMFVKTITNEPITDMRSDITTEALYVNERMAIDDWEYGYIANKEFRSLLRHSDISFVYDDDDPNPGKRFDKMIMKAGALRLARKIRSVIRK